MNKKTIIGTICGLLLLVAIGYTAYVVIMNRQPVATEQKTVSDDKKIPLSQLQANKTQGSCWTAVDKKVYNLTSYVTKHPGGVELYNGCGKEITNLFPNHPGGRFNSEKNLALIKELYIGDLVD